MMDYSKLIDSVQGIACILSMRKQTTEGSREITIAAANSTYLASVNKLEEEFVPNRPYTYYIAPDPNFEALVGVCISEGKISHKYVNAGLYEAWIDIYMIPLEDDDEGNGYCLFTYEMTKRSDSDRMINISSETAYIVLKTCIKLRENDDFNATMDSIVKDIRSQCESEGCAIILIDTEKRRIDLTFYDQGGGFAPAENDVFFSREFYRIVDRWSDIMAGSNCFIISNEEEFKAVENKDADWYNSLVYTGVNRLVLYPLRVGDNLYGYIFATNFNADRTSFIREVMELNSFILSAEVENYRMHRKLEEMSTTDMLTGVLNRNAMNRRIEELIGNRTGIKSIGVVVADVNGLKTVNDSRGHLAGDEMIKKVATRIRLVYEGMEIYRAGGDEFMIFVTDMDKDRFESLFEQLKSLSRIAGEPSFALGACYDDTGMEMEEIMHKADTEMYRNKADFYDQNPQINRRLS